ncbi:MAG: hypothetical protein QOE61_4723 [Micromonosporaceae bacterium]|nr:hypothetical protein [Micromonosporaceae bacterium]
MRIFGGLVLKKSTYDRALADMAESCETVGRLLWEGRARHLKLVDGGRWGPGSGAAPALRLRPSAVRLGDGA